MMSQSNNKPQVGVGVIVVRHNKVLLGKRKNAHGEGTWSFPGGHLEFGEEILDCAAREVLEETGLTITNATVGPFTNDIFPNENKHYLTLFVVCNCMPGEPQLLEPEKCELWQWILWENLPSPLFLPIVNLRKAKFNPIDYFQRKTQSSNSSG